MSISDLAASQRRAIARFERPVRGRRADAGQSRLPGALDRQLAALLRSHERPAIRTVQVQLRLTARRLGLRAPSRATIYNAIERCVGPSYVVRELPASVRAALYNGSPDTEVPGAQVAFYAFNHGNMRAVCWASGMEWLALHHAAAIRGWRPKSLGLLRAAMRRRRIT